MRQAIAGICAVFLGLGAADPGLAGDPAGEFDYYVLALSWNAGWCAAEGDSRRAEQCDPRHDLGFTLHGLWPQNEDGWPEFCSWPGREASRRETAAMADIMGSAGLAWHQWKKHGRCSGLDPADYFRLARLAWERVNRPAILRQLDRPLDVAPGVIEEAFIEANPGLSPDMVTVTCRDGRFREVRICLDRDLSPRPCSGGAARDCRAGSVRLDPMR